MGGGKPLPVVYTRQEEGSSPDSIAIVINISTWYGPKWEVMVKVHEITEQCFCFFLTKDSSHWRNALGTFVAFHNATTQAI